MSGHPQQARFAPNALPGADQTLDQPGSERIERNDTLHVEGHGASARSLALDALHHRLKLVRVDGRPCAARSEQQPVAGHAAAQQGLIFQYSLPGDGIIQCDISTGIDMWASTCRLAPPNTNSRSRVCP